MIEISQMLWQGGRVNERNPRIMLLSAKEFPGVEGRMIVLTAKLEIVIVIGQKMRENFLLLAQLARQNIVERFDRTPAAINEVVSARHELPTRRHAWQGAGPMVVEHHATLSQSRKIGRFHPAVSI